MKTSTLTLSLFFAIATATACDLGKGDDDTGAAGDDDSADGGVAESSDVGGYDDGPQTSTSGWPGDPSATATSAADSGCDAPHETTDPTFGDTEGWATSGGVADTGWDDGVFTSGSSSGPITATSGFDTGVDTDGDSCDVPLSPGGNFEYGCLCEDESCDIYYENVAQIPDFDGYCNCLCQAKGCGEAVGGVAEGGGGEEG